jgi:hypothetical protein
MNLREIIKKKLTTGVPGKFKTIQIKNGRKAMSFTTEGGETYVVQASLSNFVRFQNWDDVYAVADIQPTGKKVTDATGTKYPLIQLRTEVRYMKDKPNEREKEKEKEDEKENDVF